MRNTDTARGPPNCLHELRRSGKVTKEENRTHTEDEVCDHDKDCVRDDCELEVLCEGGIKNTWSSIPYHLLIRSLTRTCGGGGILPTRALHVAAS